MAGSPGAWPLADDPESKTQEPTAKKLEDAREKGEVATATEMRHAVMLAAMWGGATAVGAPALRSIGDMMGGLWGRAGELRLSDGNAHHLATSLIADFGMRLAPLLGFFLLAAMSIGAVQSQFTISAARLAPKWSKISPVAGLKRLFGAQGMVEFLKTLAKTLLVLTLCLWVLSPLGNGVQQAVGLEPGAIFRLAGSMVLDLLWVVLLLVVALAGFDFIYQRRSFRNRMRMSFQEVKDEFKESDGDPHTKMRQRQIGIARVRSRMMAAVPTASVVVTNPTHFAVALHYEHGAMRAPMVVAKGADRIALKIREIAAAGNVPIVESPPLARALFASAEIDRPIPVEHYAAVAEIISYVIELARSRRR